MFEKLLAMGADTDLIDEVKEYQNVVSRLTATEKMRYYHEIEKTHLFGPGYGGDGIGIIGEIAKSRNLTGVGIP